MNKLLRKVSVGILVVLFVVSCTTSGVKAEKEINAITPVAEAPASAKEEVAPAPVKEEAVSAPVKEEPVFAPVKEETTPVTVEVAAPAKTETIVETKPVEAVKPLLETELEYMGIKADVTAYETHALISLPEGTTEAAVVEIVKSFPSEISTEGVTYTFHDGILELTYPSLTKEDLEVLAEKAEEAFKAYIDSVIKEEKLPKYEVYVELAGGKLDKSYYPKEELSFVDGTSVIWIRYDGKHFGVNFDGGALVEGVTVSSLIEALSSGSVTAPDLVKDGYLFLGWKNERTGLIDRNFTITFDSVTDGDVYTAQFEEIINPVTSYVVNMTADGVALSGYPLMVSDDISGVALPTPEREYYTFDGFRDSESNIVDSVSFTEKSSSDITLEASWTPVEYSITYDEEGIEYREKPVEVKEAEMEAEVVVEEAKNPGHYNVEDEFTLLPLNRDKYIFKGWIEEGEESYLANPDYRFVKGTHGDKTLVSVWQPRTYSITYIGAGSYCGPSSYVYGSGDIAVGEPEVAEGIAFLGWKESGTDNEPSVTYVIDSTRGEDIVLEAVCVPIEYSILYDEEGVEYIEKTEEAAPAVVTVVEEPKNPDFYTIEDEFTLLPLDRDKYIFMGWIEEGEESYLADPAYRFVLGTHGDKSMVSVWLAKTYSISYRLNAAGVSFNGPESYVYNTGDIAIASPEEVEGLVFLGWRENGTDNEPSTTYMLDSTRGEDIVLEAVWEPVEYTIEYDLDGGSLPEGVVNPSSYNKLSRTFTLRAPERRGYRFVGWQYEGMKEVNTMLFSAVFSSDWASLALDVYEDHINISFSAADDSVTDLLEDVIAEAFPYARYDVYSSGIRIDFTPETEYELESLINEVALEMGLERVRTEEKTTFVSDSITIGSGTVGNLSFKAVWDIVYYNIYYDEEGVLYRVPAMKEKEVTNPSQYTVNDAFTIVNPSRIGYDFVGWIIDGEEVTLARPIYSIELGTVGDKSLLAVWKEKDYSITYDLDGGKLEGDPAVSYTYSFESVNLPTPVRKGYRFVGWMDEEEGKYISRISSFSGRDFSLRAVWKLETYHVTYRLDGGELEMYEENPLSYTVEDEELVLSNPVRKGYTFKGWYEGNGRYTKKTVLLEEYTIDTARAEDITLNALWEAVDYPITYVLDGGSYRFEIVNPESYTIEDYVIIANPYRDGYDFTGWVIAGDRTETHTIDKRIEKGTTGAVKLIATWKKSTVGLGVVTEKQKNLVVYGRDNIERPDWVVETPTSDGWYYEKVYVKESENIYEAAESAKKMGVAQFAMRRGATVDNLDKNLNGTPYITTSLKLNSVVFDIEIVEIWVDSDGGTWVLMKSPR